MLNYPTFNQKGSYHTQTGWTNSKHYYKLDNEWRGDLEIQLMAIGLKLMTPQLGIVFAQKYPIAIHLLFLK